MSDFTNFFQAFFDFTKFFSYRDDSSSGDEDLDDEGIQRRRELMRQKALARAQIGMGQEEVMAKEDEKSASEGMKK